MEEFIDVLKYCLVYPDKIAADRMLMFVSKFAASLYSYKALIHDSDDPEDDIEHPFVNGLFDFLFQVGNYSLGPIIFPKNTEKGFDWSSRFKTRFYSKK